MAEPQQLAVEIARLNALEQRIINRFIHRRGEAPDAGRASESIGDRVADQVTAFGGSWTFIFFTVAAIAAWMVVNTVMASAFDAPNVESKMRLRTISAFSSSPRYSAILLEISNLERQAQAQWELICRDAQILLPHPVHQRSATDGKRSA